MNIPVDFAKWSANNLPAGLKLKNGVISGQPTAETGIYTIPFSVVTPWGKDTKNITINVREKLKFAIYQNGAKLEDISLNELITSISNGTAQEKYNCTNTQLMIPFITPALKYEYNTASSIDIRPSQIDTVALNFCSFRNVTLEDGTVKPALILQFDKRLWANFCCFDTGDSTGDPDGESGHYEIDPDWVDGNSVTNRWRYSNLRQWLNSAGTNWFSPAYDTDIFLTYDQLITYTSLMRNPDSIGFLSCLPEDLLECIQPIKIQTQAFFNEDNFDESIEEPDIIDNVYVDITYDKIFIPSLEEMNVKPSDTDGYYNGKKIYANDGIEGTAWEYYINKFGSQSRVVSDTAIDDIHAWGKNLGYDFELPAAYDNGLTFFQNADESGHGHFTRSAILNNNYEIWKVVSTENNILKIPRFDTVLNDFEGDAWYGTQPAPAFALC